MPDLPVHDIRGLTMDFNNLSIECRGWWCKDVVSLSDTENIMDSYPAAEKDCPLHCQVTANVLMSLNFFLIPVRLS